MTRAILDDFKGFLVDAPELAAHTVLWLVKERRDWLAVRGLRTGRGDVALAKEQEIVDGDKLKARMAV